MWTKIGDEWRADSRDLPDAAYRLHIDAVVYSNICGLDLLIPKHELRRFCEVTSAEPTDAVKQLIAAGWWEDRGDTWWIGCRYPEWQLPAAVVEQRRAANALRVRRHRLHGVGDHSLCLPENCADAHPEDADVTHVVTHYPGRVGEGGAASPQ